ncbi:LytTr DNA-binding domain-containing protein [Hymenobacter daecheongensis DSM 21074]|uniref:LytTr DNA-binding domain-containing protein n=1 Tax=Hymenobacter daecheongensis DSM 21074 TaxID=1121955 RepID=A0A1M6CR37_9BACT|nr:LytTR family DNA-binding domain-containing protein [Hymenobacter daecheongensis]SHI63482.1 LytTr DNA-binding domain-containing protein [Hymenobacter daecheongensis DSM 21074]
MILTTFHLRFAGAAIARLRGLHPGSLLRQSSLVLWAAITLLFLYERTYLIQKAGLPHFVACAGVRVGLLLLLCYGHNSVLVPRLLARRHYGCYALVLSVAVGAYLLTQSAYDHYLFGFVIGDQERAGLWRNLPYNLLVTGWYLLLTHLVARRLPTREPMQEPSALPASAESTAEEVVIKTGGEWMRLPVAAIRYAQGLKDYTILYTPTGKHLVKGSIGKVAEWLPAGCFLRVHKSYLVARQHIRSVSSTEVMLEGQAIPIGRAYATALAEFKQATTATAQSATTSSTTKSH